MHRHILLPCHTLRTYTAAIQSRPGRARRDNPLPVPVSLGRVKPIQQVMVLANDITQAHRCKNQNVHRIT